jgi:hypothetical protein
MAIPISATFTYSGRECQKKLFASILCHMRVIGLIMKWSLYISIAFSFMHWQKKDAYISRVADESIGSNIPSGFLAVLKGFCRQ